MHGINQGSWFFPACLPLAAPYITAREAVPAKAAYSVAYYAAVGKDMQLALQRAMAFYNQALGMWS